MTHGFMKKASRDKTPSYYRSNLTRDDIRRVMEGSGPLSISQLAGLLWDVVPPESKSRYALLQGGNLEASIDILLVRGMRRIVQLKMPNLVVDGKVHKHGSGKEARYEWIAGKANTPEANPAGRANAVKAGAKRGRNKRVRGPSK